MVVTRKRKARNSTNTSLEFLNNINEKSRNQKDKKHDPIWDIPLDPPEDTSTSRRTLRSRLRSQIQTQLPTTKEASRTQIRSNETQEDASPNTDNETVPLSQFQQDSDDGYDQNSGSQDVDEPEDLPEQEQSPGPHPTINHDSDHDSDHGDDQNSGSQESGELEKLGPEQEQSPDPLPIINQNSPEEDEIDDPFPERFTFYSEADQPAEIVHDSSASNVQDPTDLPSTSTPRNSGKSSILPGTPSEIASASESEGSDFEEMRPLAQDGFLRFGNESADSDVGRSRSPPPDGVATVIPSISQEDPNPDIDYYRNNEDVEYAGEDEHYERARSPSQDGSATVIPVIAQKDPDLDPEYFRDSIEEDEGAEEEDDEDYERERSHSQDGSLTVTRTVLQEDSHPAYHPDSDESFEDSDGVDVDAEYHWYLNQDDELMKWFNDMINETPSERDWRSLSNSGIAFQSRISGPIPRYLNPACEMFQMLRKTYDSTARLPRNQLDLMDSIFDEIKGATDFPSSTIDDPKSAGEKVFELETYMVPQMVKQIIFSFRAYMTLGRLAYDQFRQSLQLLLDCSNRMNNLRKNRYIDIEKKARYSWSLRGPLKNILRAIDENRFRPQSPARTQDVDIETEEIWTPEQDKTLIKALQQFTG
ncbi:hypothetical protein N7495_003982 [Penicillium taxi]|uniref:uncharacterized protein n=1 Tax=Penicillium taxi TaxID=168475 RepID=UPI00254562C0|nr:uncharacterized protein N7495_003982 [Penicillium taxi]KAJ5899238.1 hypothetical protein N7495_003982 [Penicillium taxi]